MFFFSSELLRTSTEVTKRGYCVDQFPSTSEDWHKRITAWRVLQLFRMLSNIYA